MRDTAARVAKGSDVPAGLERNGDAPTATSSRERGRIRRRLREVRRLREAGLLELGALVLEAHRHERDDSPVIKRKAAEVAALDDEAQALASALATDAGLESVIVTGISGPCPTCGVLSSTSSRFCPVCGTALDGRPDAGPREPETTELPAPNGDGTSPSESELEATTGGDQ
jgi:hypothetical protein